MQFFPLLIHSVSTNNFSLVWANFACLFNLDVYSPLLSTDQTSTGASDQFIMLTNIDRLTWLVCLSLSLSLFEAPKAKLLSYAEGVAPKRNKTRDATAFSCFIPSNGQSASSSPRATFYLGSISRNIPTLEPLGFFPKADCLICMPLSLSPFLYGPHSLLEGERWLMMLLDQANLSRPNSSPMWPQVEPLWLHC